MTLSISVKICDLKFGGSSPAKHRYDELEHWGRKFCCNHQFV